MIRPRLKFETAEDRRKAAEKIRAEAEQVSLGPLPKLIHGGRGLDMG